MALGSGLWSAFLNNTAGLAANPYAPGAVSSLLPKLRDPFAPPPATMPEATTAHRLASTGAVSARPATPPLVQPDAGRLPAWMSVPGMGGEMPVFDAADLKFYRPGDLKGYEFGGEAGDRPIYATSLDVSIDPQIAARYNNGLFGRGIGTADAAIFPGPDENSFWLRRKTGGKEGTEVLYRRQGDQFVPVPDQVRTTPWDTNSGFRDIAPALALLAPAAAGIAFPGLFGAGGAAGAGTAATGDFFGGLSAAEAGAFGTGAGNVSGLFGAGATGAGAAGATGAAGAAGATGAAGAAGAGAAGDFFGGLGAAEAGAFGTGAGNVSGLFGAGAGTGWLGTLGSVLGAPGVLPGLVNAIGGAIDRNSARSDNAAFRDLQIQQGEALRGAAQQYATGLGGLFEQYKGAYDPFYAAVDTGVSRSTIDPVTGRVGFTLNAPYQAQRDALFGAAGDVLAQARGFNPRDFANERYSAAQQLLAPGDQLAQQDLLQQMYRKGGFGLSLNQPAAGGGTTQVNPYLSTFLNAQNQRNAQMAYQSLQEGENYLDRLLGRQRGLFGAGAAIDEAGYRAVPSAFDASRQFMQDRQRAAEFGYGAGRERLGIPYQAERDYINALYGAQQRYAGTEAAAGQLQRNAYWDALRGIDYGELWKRLFGG